MITRRKQLYCYVFFRPAAVKKNFLKLFSFCKEQDPMAAIIDWGRISGKADFLSFRLSYFLFKSISKVNRRQ